MADNNNPPDGFFDVYDTLPDDVVLVIDVNGNFAVRPDSLNWGSVAELLKRTLSKIE